MKNWTIKKRIVAGFATILALVAVLTATSYVLLRQARNAAHFMTVDAMPGMDAMSQIKGLVGDCQIDVLRDLLAKTPDEHKKFRDAIAAGHEQRDKLRDDYEKSITTSEDRELFGQLKATAAQYSTARNQLLDLIDAGKMEEALQFNVASVRPIFLKYDVTPDELAFIESHRNEYPELDTITVHRRLYPKNGFAAHLIGYVGEVSDEMLNQPQFQFNSVGDIVGQSGVEKYYNDILMGQNGSRRVLVNTHLNASRRR